MASQVTPVNVQVPTLSSAAVVADFVEHALRVAYVQRRDTGYLASGEWASPGVYVLLTDDGSHQAYVGKAVDLRKRLLQHRSQPKLNWSRAIAVRRDTTHGFNSAEIGYLEGRLAAEIDALPGLSVVEGKRDEDSTLPPHMLLSLDALLPSILAALRLGGVDTFRADLVEDELDDSTEASPTSGLPADVPKELAGATKRRGRIAYPSTRTTIAGSVPELVAAGLLRAGATLTARNAGRIATARVSPDGGLVVDGVQYPSPSRAASQALNLKSVNGWITWHVGDLAGPTLAALRTQLRAEQ